MRRPHLVIAALFGLLVAIPAAFSDEGMRVLPQALYGLAGIWTAPQKFGQGLTVSGNPGSIVGDGTEGCHFSYNAGTGFFTCAQNGGAYKALYIESSALVLGVFNPTQSYAFQGTGGFKITGSPVALPKLGTAPAAPGAGLGQLYWTAGTVAGTCKLVAMAGTSTTPTTVLDNVGSGC